MCSDIKLMVLAIIALLTSCSVQSRRDMIARSEVKLSLSVADESDEGEREEDVEVLIDSIKGSMADEPLIMRAIKDSETGEMVATDYLQASKVVARFRNVAERHGFVTISFDISVPEDLLSSSWQLKMLPAMMVQQDTISLDPLFITGERYREGQLRAYERYRRFLESIVSDPDDLMRVRQFEIFLMRHFPETYAMKNDSTFIEEHMAENLFGVTQRDAFEHYRKTVKWALNEKRKGRKEEMYRRFVKDPILKEGVRLDTVLKSAEGTFVYRYSHTFRTRPQLRKVDVALKGSIYEDGEPVLELPYPEKLTFYISSLSSLADDKIRYRMLIRNRIVRDNTKALVEFAHASADVDTSLGNNASELRRLKNCIGDIVLREEYVLDSLVIAASCSPEGSFSYNQRLSQSRSEAVKTYFKDHVPDSWRDCLKSSVIAENWDQFIRLVESDTLMSEEVRRNVVILCRNRNCEPDSLERCLSRLPEYGYMKEKIYPILRHVDFDFYMHRKDMVQDTVYTMEVDTVYMSGLRALKEMDYKKAATLLLPYEDYNTALAYTCAGYNHSAMDILCRSESQDAKASYLKAVLLARLKQREEAVKYFELARACEPQLAHRANLDPEMYEILKLKRENDE